MKNNIREGSESDKDFNVERWMLQTMGEIMGKTEQELDKYTYMNQYRAGFRDLWVKASRDEMIKFIEKTRFSEEVPYYKDVIEKYRDQFYKMLPHTPIEMNNPRDHVGNSIKYYLAPKDSPIPKTSDNNKDKPISKKPDNQPESFSEDQWYQ